MSFICSVRNKISFKPYTLCGQLPLVKKKYKDAPYGDMIYTFLYIYKNYMFSYLYVLFPLVYRVLPSALTPPSLSVSIYTNDLT